MAGNVTGFQRPFTFRENTTQKTVGLQQAVKYKVDGDREVEVPEADNEKCVGVVTYQYEDRDGGTVAVQLDKVAVLKAFGAIAAGDDIIVGVGGTAKKASTVAVGTLANVLGEAQHNAVDGQEVQILIRPKAYKI